MNKIIIVVIAVIWVAALLRDEYYRRNGVDPADKNAVRDFKMKKKSAGRFSSEIQEKVSHIIEKAKKMP